MQVCVHVRISTHRIGSGRIRGYTLRLTPVNTFSVSALWESGRFLKFIGFVTCHFLKIVL